MTTFKAGSSAVSIQLAKPTQAFGSLEHPPLELGQRAVLMRAALPNLPSSAIITKAELRFNVHGSWPGSVTMNLRRNSSAFTGRTTWNTAPVVTGPTWSKTQTNSADWAEWAIDVTSDVVDFYAGDAINYGWRLAAGDATFRRIRGAAASSMRPYVWVEYATKPAAPSNLIPSGAAVDEPSPTLGFKAPEDMIAVQVQIDPSKNESSPAWSSGTTPRTRGTFSLSDSTYPGLANGASTYWRVRAQTAQGWSPWSSWATFSRVDNGTLTVTSPGATTADPTPPVAWTFTGDQGAYRVQVRDATGAMIEDTGKQPGADAAWQPKKSWGGDGDPVQVAVTVWDKTLRTVTPKRSGAVTQTRSTVIDFEDTYPTISLQASQDGRLPCVVLRGHVTGTLPDQVLISRQPVAGGRWEIAGRYNSVDVFSGQDFEVRDWTCPMAGEVRYRAQAVVNGKASKHGPTVKITPSTQGLWLVDDSDPADVDYLVVWDTDEGTWSREEFAVVHETAGGKLIRRRLAAMPYSGECSGLVADAAGFEVAKILLTAERFRRNDAGRVYRLIAGHLNIPVIAGNITVIPSPASRSTDVVARVAWSWWGA